MKLILALLFSVFSIGLGIGQQQYADSLKKAWLSEKEDSSKVEILGLLSSYYSNLYPDSGFYYSDRIIQMSTKNNYQYGLALGWFYKSNAISKQGDFTTAIQAAYKSLNLSTELKEHRLSMLSRSYEQIGEINTVNNNSRQAVNYLYKSIDLQNQSGVYNDDFYRVYFSLALSMLFLDKKDSALLFLKKGWDLFSTAKSKRNIDPWIVSGNVYRFSGNPEKALFFFHKGIQLSKKYNSLFFLAAICNQMGDLCNANGMKDSAIYYMHQCLSLAQKYNYKVFEMFASANLADTYDGINKDSTLKYIKMYVATKDEIYSDEKIKQFQAASFDEENKERNLEDAKTKYRNRLKIYALIGAAIIFLAIAFILFQSNKHKQKANKLLTKEKEKVESTLHELKVAQSQLIQSEKMASLGELTAGIAHEIQNPLNFVNNFSEVNKEMIAEMKEEISKGNYDEVKNIAGNIEANEEKINHHGKRADAIVKGMLQHSRSSTGAKELTDINKLADEYLRLAFHGLRAKDNSFNATIKTGFDNTIDKINIVPQDIGRVLLNLLTNAFYAVNEKRKAEGSGFEPSVSISTKRLDNKVEIKVTDNGSGIPQNIVDKIFQPFFTTKPTGQGTGLGLSLSYDIIKSHGGEIKVETKEGIGTEFIIQLPVL